MNVEKKRQILLLILLAINIVATILHYTDNFIFFENYPAPASMKADSVYIAWLILTPIGIGGYIQYVKGNFWISYLCLCVYSVTSVGGLAHYLFGSMEYFSLKMNALIWFEALAGIVLLGFTFWSGLILKEGSRRDPINEV